MRTACLLLMAAMPLTSGCSILIAARGEDMEKLTTRDQVRERFGEPRASVSVEGVLFEEYRTRRKISEPDRAWALSMCVGLTYGLAEFIAFPHELYLLGSRTLLGQDVRFTYDSAGNLRTVHLDGLSIRRGGSDKETTARRSEEASSPPVGLEDSTHPTKSTTARIPEP